MKKILLSLPIILLILISFRSESQQGESGYKSVSITRDKGTPAQPVIEEKEQVQTEVISDMETLSDIDKNVPVSGKKYSNRFALIVGNEDYHSFQTTMSSEINVDFAERDAELFRKYALKTLGIPEENILFKLNAGHIEMKRMFDKINLILKHSGGNAEVFVYYSGHGFPDLATKTPYLIPVDVSATDLQYGLKLEDIYRSLAEYPSKRVTVFLDACFSGGGRNIGLLAARGIKVKPRTETVRGNLVVFCASSEDQSALPFKEEKHGLFTYYLLKKIKETKGDVTYSELSEYICRNVPIKSIMVNNLEQTPQVNYSQSLGDKWKYWIIK
jgi:hypothetical protein